jgi:hypothetical protein
MAINLNDNLQIQAPKATDGRYGPYSSESVALLSLDPTVRYQGLTVGIFISGELKEYWFKSGISDIDFVVKETGGPVDPPEPSYEIGVCVSNEITPIHPGIKSTMRSPYTMKFDKIRLSSNTPPVGGGVSVDVRVSGESILSSSLTIPDGQTVDSSPATFSKDSIVVGETLEIIASSVGSTAAATGLKVWISGVELPCDQPYYVYDSEIGYHLTYGCSVNVNPHCVTDLSHVWQNCTGLTSFPKLYTVSCTDFSSTWSGCTGLTAFPLIDTSKGITFNSTWGNCTGLSSFPVLDVSSGEDFSSAWGGCTFSSFPQLDFGNAVNISGAWTGCSNLTSFPVIDTSSVTNFNSSWWYCSNLTSFPTIDTSSGVNFDSAWAVCSGLTSFPTLDTSSGSIFQSTWAFCSGLTSFPALDLSSGTTFNGAWRYCSNLRTFPANMFNSCTATDFFEAWQSCNLSYTSVNNILISLDTAGQSNGVVNLDGGTSAGPALGGITATNNLVAKGWTVQTNAPILGSPWTPANMTTRLWYDFSDSSTITTSGGFLTQINDKSGNNTHASQSNSSKRPTLGQIGGISCMVTTSTQYVEVSGGSLGGIRSYVSVVEFSSTAADQFLVGSSGSYDFHGSSNNYLLSSSFSSSNVRNGSGWVNGTATAPLDMVKLTSVTAYEFNTLGNVSIGQFSADRSNSTGSRSLIGKTCEIIACSTVLSTTDRQKLEGYLAHKWGFAGNLPSGHPYKSIPPFNSP